MTFKEIYQTRIEDYDINGLLSVEAVLRIFENIGSHHSDSVSNSVIKGSLNGIAWIFVEWRIEIERLPKYGELVKAETWINGKAPSSSVMRNFLLSDNEGNTLIKGTAKFALFDLIKRKPTRISAELFEMYSPENFSVFENKSERLREPEEYDFELQLVQRRSDVDFNGHVHNINYLIYALEALPKSVYESRDFSCVRILYKNPLKSGETINVKVRENDGVYSVGIYGEDKISSIVEIS
ncbi:MAG: hypothetical protein K2F81_01040 [Ruminococcus sp.]|nr:hypothetical protein [Ruminococcus sp.]